MEKTILKNLEGFIGYKFFYSKLTGPKTKTFLLNIVLGAQNKIK